MNNDLLDLYFFSDEAWFYLSGYVNSQYMRMWSAENGFFLRIAITPEIGLWVFNWARFVSRTYYRCAVQNILKEFIHELYHDELHNCYFRQDGATARTAPIMLNYIRTFYDDRLINSRTDHVCPLRSPDLTPLDYFLLLQKS
jgi:hypothetical protein